MKSIFYKNKLEIGVKRVVFKQVTNYSSIGRTELTSFLGRILIKGNKRNVVVVVEGNNRNVVEGKQ